ncbi:hypothetical protein Pcinc_019000 [Petrolisthes cinctipes]|uniref:Uncharacterized protein n=1 Tax=Petrolisthes cinctipes TaxID=88211 RepID=A0AAE1KKP9_PETCI|nr:hypothetical protein Pcinc_020895 [Petrolisthes cinctipes]KAK3876179.1 hypothetical protein Pcinc_019000 [Petrolisthes cinctipes]
MAYSGPATLAEVEADLNLSEEEDIADKHWPPLKLQTQLPGPTPWQPKVDTPYPTSQPTTSTSTSSKRPVIIATVTTFSEKLEALASRFELISDHVLKVPPQRSTQSGIASVSLPPSASRKNRNP